MNDEQIKKIVEDTYDNFNEEGFMSMLRDFYNRKTLAIERLRKVS